MAQLALSAGSQITELKPHTHQITGHFLLRNKRILSSHMLGVSAEKWLQPSVINIWGSNLQWD